LTMRTNCSGSRREFLWEAGAGFAGLALSALLDRDGFFGRVAAARDDEPAGPMIPRKPQRAPRAKRVIFLFMYGGPPSMDTWVCYGLGSENQNLPGYVVMLDPRGGPISGAANWSSGFMPASFQGTHLRSRGEPVLDLASKTGATPEMQRDLIDSLAALN